VRANKRTLQLEGFNSAEEEMIETAINALQTAGYDINLLKVLIRADLPPGSRGMTLEDGAVLGKEAFSSLAMLNHVLEEELLHQGQKGSGLAETFQPGTARKLEEAIDAERKFPLPGP
jgi:hypothetical protein